MRSSVISMYPTLAFATIGIVATAWSGSAELVQSHPIVTEAADAQSISALPPSTRALHEQGYQHQQDNHQHQQQQHTQRHTQRTADHGNDSQLHRRTDRLKQRAARKGGKEHDSASALHSPQRSLRANAGIVTNANRYSTITAVDEASQINPALSKGPSGIVAVPEPPTHAPTRVDDNRANSRAGAFGNFPKSPKQHADGDTGHQLKPTKSPKKMKGVNQENHKKAKYKKAINKKATVPYQLAKQAKKDVVTP